MLFFIGVSIRRIRRPYNISIHPMLFFIDCREMCLRGCTTISIHPMLFFILYGCNVMADLYRFQYILCYFLSQKNSWNDMTGCISIHPMLFFINTGSNAYLRASNFNTSYVIFYPCCLQSHCFCGSNFNTSYVIFYRGNEVVVIFCQ